MTVYPKGACQIKLDNASAALTDFGTQVTGITIDRGNMVGKFHTFGTGTGEDQRALDGGNETSGSFDFVNSSETTELFHVLRQWASAKGNKTLEVGIPDLVTSGSYKITMEIKQGKRSKLVDGSAGSGDPQMPNMNFEADGAVTEGTV